MYIRHRKDEVDLLGLQHRTELIASDLDVSVELTYEGSALPLDASTMYTLDALNQISIGCDTGDAVVYYRRWSATLSNARVASCPAVFRAVVSFDKDVDRSTPISFLVDTLQRASNSVIDSYFP